jgi:hypothetical protein
VFAAFTFPYMESHTGFIGPSRIWSGHGGVSKGKIANRYINLQLVPVLLSTQ